MGCMSSKSKQESMLKDAEKPREHPQIKKQSQFNYPDLTYQQPINQGPSKLEAAKVSNIPSNVQFQQHGPYVETIRQQNISSPSKIPYAQSVANGLNPSNPNSNVVHQSNPPNHQENVHNSSNIKLPHVSNIQKVVESSNLHNLGPNYSKIPISSDKSEQLKFPSNVAALSNVPQVSSISNEQNINKGSQINPKPNSSHAQNPNRSEIPENPLSHSIPRDQSVQGVAGDMKSKIQSELQSGIVRSNIGFKQRSGIQHVHASEAFFNKRNLKVVQQEDEIVHDENVANYTIPIQNFNLSYRVVK